MTTLSKDADGFISSVDVVDLTDQLGGTDLKEKETKGKSELHSHHLLKCRDPTNARRNRPHREPL